MKIKSHSRWMVLAAGVVWLGTAFATEAQVASSSEAESSAAESTIAYPPSLEPLFSEESSYQARCRIKLLDYGTDTFSDPFSLK